MFRRVPGSMKELEREVPERHPFTVARFVRREPQRRPGAGKDPCADGGELSRARHEVGMDVGLDRGDDLDAVLARGRNVDIDVTPRIDDDAFPCCVRTRRGTTPARALLRRNAGTFGQQG